MASQADLSEADLRRATLIDADLSNANLRRADLKRTNMSGANLSCADLRNADLTRARLASVHVNGADLRGAKLLRAELEEADVTSATCRGADFSRAHFVRSILNETDLTGARVYGIAAWDLTTIGAIQRDLIITPPDVASEITVDDLQVAQFIYLLLNNNRLRTVIDAVTSKVVLILGRFTPERKAVLDAVRDELRRRNYLPVLFDFEKPTNPDLTETLSTLAHMARFVIADLTDAKSIPQELGRIVPFLPSVPIQPILLASECEWGMFESFPRYPWVLEIVRYESQAELISNIPHRVIAPAELKARDQIRAFR